MEGTDGTRRYCQLGLENLLTGVQAVWL
jgi:hypothetical protein